MKKILLFAVAAAAVLASCGNKTQQPTVQSDSLETQVFADSVIAKLDSMSQIISQISDTTKLSQLISSERINLSVDQKKVKPDYLITQTEIDALSTLQQKYVAMAYLSIDHSVQQLYHSDDDDYYNNAMGRLAAETDAVNQKQADKVAKQPLNFDNALQFYQDMKDRNRLDKFYIAEAAYIVEALYIISKNTDLYMQSIDDKAAANLTRMLATVINGEEIIAENGHPEMEPVVDALVSIRNINATNAKDLKAQLSRANVQLAKVRKALLQ